MRYLLPLCLALGLVFVAVVLVLVQQRFSDRQRVLIVSVTFGAGVVANWLTSVGNPQTDPLKDTLTWTYSALTMFAGADFAQSLQTVAGPDWLPQNVLEAVRFFIQVFAFLFTVSAIIAALASDTMSRLAVRLRTYDEVFEVRGTSSTAQALAQALSAEPRAKRRRTHRLVALVIGEDFRLEDRSAFPSGSFAVLREEALVRRKLSRAARGHLIVVDDRSPGFFDQVKEVLDEVEDFGDNLTVYVVVSTPWLRDRLATLPSPVELRVIDPASLVARSLVARRPPVAEIAFEEGRPTRRFSALVVGDGDEVQSRVIEHLVMNSQFLDAQPRITVVGSSAHAADFLMRHPEAAECCDLEFPDCEPSSTEFHDVLREQHFDQVIVVNSDADAAMAAAQEVVTFFSLHRPDVELPRILVRGDASESPSDSLTFFGAYSTLFSSQSLIDEEQDRLARRVNAFYHGHDPQGPGADEKAGRLWRGLTQINRMSSRASADFATALAKVRESTAHLAPDAAADVLARTEHLRWNAFYRMLGYQTMSLSRMRARFEELDGAGTPDERGRQARDDQIHRQHACLVPWDDLRLVDRAYNALPGVRPRNFQETDLAVLGLLQAVVPTGSERLLRAT